MLRSSDEWHPVESLVLATQWFFRNDFNNKNVSMEEIVKQNIEPPRVSPVTPKKFTERPSTSNIVAILANASKANIIRPPEIMTL